MAYTIVTLGDSVMWGQGLLSKDKFAFLIADKIVQTLQLPQGTQVDVHQYAHSTATVWKDESTIFNDVLPFPSKLPLARTPSDAEILQQQMPEPDAMKRESVGELIRVQPFTWNQIYASSKTLAPNAVDLVLLNAGINDVGLINLFLPYKNPVFVLDRILSFRGYISRLMNRTHQCFPKARIIVTGYYPVVSDKTDFTFLWQWIVGFFSSLRTLPNLPSEVSTFLQALPHASENAIRAFSRPFLFSNDPVALLFAGPVSLDDNLILLSKLWATKIHQVLREEVEGFNTFVGVKVAAFADPHYQPENCLYAPDSWLWQLDSQLEPMDPIAPSRKTQCLQDPFLYFVCYRASLGHPNFKGASAYADACIHQLNNW